MPNFRQIKGSEQIILSREDMFSNGWDVLSPGVYNIANMAKPYEPAQPMWMPLPLPNGLVSFSSGVVNDVIVATDKFLSEPTTNVFKELKICHKMGIILHGPHGTGETKFY